MEGRNEVNLNEDVSEFHFIDLTNMDSDSKKRNLIKVRSHVMKGIRRRHRTENKQLKPNSRSEISTSEPKTDFDSHSISTSIDRSMVTCANSSVLRIETDILPTFTNTWKWTTWGYRMLHFSKFSNIFS